MHRALYRKWRPMTFDQVCGQEHITSILKYETANNKFSHAYLFCGSRGTGKTTCAKLLARAVNCLSPRDGNPCGECEACRGILDGSATDVLEMDAASNNGVENIRDIRDEVVYSPSSLRYRVYIVDEVHMLSGSAFNALLKTLEEPPAHVIFILATTELHKLPSTIVSRCQRFDFRRLTVPVITERLAAVAAAEHIPLEEDAALRIARIAQGGMRDALSLLELCAGGDRAVTEAVVREVTGASSREQLAETVSAIARRDCATLFAIVDEVVTSSRDISVFWQDLIAFYRDMLVMLSTPDAPRYLDLTVNEAEQLSALSAQFDRETILNHTKHLENALAAMQRSGSIKRMCAELALIRLCDPRLDNSTEALLNRVADLERRLALMAAGNPIPVEQSAPAAAAEPAPAEQPTPAEEKPAVPAPDPAPAVAKDPAGTAQLHALPVWPEVIDQLRQRDAALSSFLQRAKAAQDSAGCVIVRVNNPFMMTMIDRPANRELLLAALAAQLPTPPAGLRFEVSTPEVALPDDDIFTAIEGN
ncbi:MAG: DNA polymerase III subunit gamma/tau [Ruminococcaceae bacterium]|nr:DNA polymerase III subunit gamma/tau [Oscillospiraceae bacterium]